MRLHLPLAALALTLSAPLLAQAADPAPDAPAAEPVKKAKKPKVVDPNALICKPDKRTGSRMAMGKTCLTAREWQEQADLAREGMDNRNRSTAND